MMKWEPETDFFEVWTKIMAHKMIVLRKKLFVILESPLTSCKNNGSKTIEQTTIRNFTKEGMYKKVSKKVFDT